jgi:enoyl-CoA hydratase/carnithine racemase
MIICYWFAGFNDFVPVSNKTGLGKVHVQNSPLLVERKNHIATLTLNRPEKKNALSPDLVEILLETLRELSADDAVRTLIIRGAGDRAFCSGYDIGALPTTGSGDKHDRLKTLRPVESLFQTLINFPFPVIAMISGAAFGAGCELAVCCDIRVGSRHARMGMPPAKLGLVYPWPGLQRFIRTVGLQSTREMFFTGRTYTGERLKELGLLNYLVEADELASFTGQLAADIAANAPLALQGTKRVLNLLLQSTTLPDDSRAEAEFLAEAAFQSEDLKEAQRAFFEKRKPEFRGH